MNEHYLNAERTRQRQQTDQAQAATERSLRALRRSRQTPGVAPDGRGLLADLVSGMRLDRARLALR
jgi:hypothetical protein